jgi:hypothetical protein
MIHAAAEGAIDTFRIAGGNFLETLPRFCQAIRTMPA